MKITLVNPPFNYFPGIGPTRYNYCRPPLGVCYLASYAAKYGEGFEFSIVDCLAANKDMSEWLDIIAKTAPDVIGISVVTPTVNTAKRMVQALRKTRPDALFVAGGPHATVRHEELLDDFDAAVLGEGEETFLDILNARAAGKNLEGITGAATAKNTPATRRDFIMPLDRIPPPARELLDLPAYYHSFPYNQRGGLFTTMFTARGCPRDCYFCANKSLWNGRLRYHSIEYVSAEIEMLSSKFGMGLIFIDDDDFLSNKKRAMQICETIKQKSPLMRWVCHCCVSNLDEESVREMRRTGCVEIQIGVESGDPEILKNIPKSPAPEKVVSAFRMLKKFDINSWATFIIGHPGETRNSVMNTIEFAKRIDPTYASFIMLLPFPGSRAFDTYLEAGLLKTTNWDDYTWHGAPVFETPDLPAGELVSLRSLAMRRFYLRPKKFAAYSLSMLRAGSAKEIFRNFILWLSLIRQKNAGENRK